MAGVNEFITSFIKAHDDLGEWLRSLAGLGYEELLRRLFGARGGYVAENYERVPPEVRAKALAYILLTWNRDYASQLAKLGEYLAKRCETEECLKLGEVIYRLGRSILSAQRVYSDPAVAAGEHDRLLSRVINEEVVGRYGELLRSGVVGAVDYLLRWIPHRGVEALILDDILTWGPSVKEPIAVPVGGRVDGDLVRLGREYIRFKGELNKMGYIKSPDDSTMAYVLGDKLFIRVGSSPGHASRVWREGGTYRFEYFDDDYEVNERLIKLIRALGGEASPLMSGDNIVGVTGSLSDGEALVRALSLMASEDFRLIEGSSFYEGEEIYEYKDMVEEEIKAKIPDNVFREVAEEVRRAALEALSDDNYLRMIRTGAVSIPYIDPQNVTTELARRVKTRLRVSH